MAKCKKGTYTSNTVVLLSRPIVCYGYKPIDQPKCEFLHDCKHSAEKTFERLARIKTFEYLKKQPAVS